MRIFVCVTVVVCTVAAGVPPVHAQGASFGLKGGLAAATAAADAPGAIEFDTGAGFAAGAFASIGIAARARLQVELLFSRRQFDGADVPIGISVRGVELPILLQVALGSSDRARPVLFAGPQLSFISKVTQSSAAGESDISDDIAGVDAGVTFGGGVEITAGRGAVVIDARANLGMKNLNAAAGPSLKSRAFLAMVGYRF